LRSGHVHSRSSVQGGTNHYWQLSADLQVITCSTGNCGLPRCRPRADRKLNYHRCLLLVKPISSDLISCMSKSSAVAEMGNRLAAIDKGRKVAAVVPLSVGGAEFPSITMWPGPRATSVPSGILIHPAVWHNRHGPKSWGCCATYFWGRWVTPHLTHCRLGRGLPPYQVAS